LLARADTRRSASNRVPWKNSKETVRRSFGRRVNAANRIQRAVIHRLINNRILTDGPYKALKETHKLVATTKDHLDVNYAANAYAKIAKETVPPRDLEATLLLEAAAKLQAVHDSWQDKPASFKDAVLYNRKLWMVFLDAVTRDDNKLPEPVRKNLAKLGMFVMSETYALMTKPTLNQLKAIIKVNRGIAAGLRGKA
jgi:flagellar biosynthesis activator protein FlaF